MESPVGVGRAGATTGAGAGAATGAGAGTGGAAGAATGAGAGAGATGNAAGRDCPLPVDLPWPPAFASTTSVTVASGRVNCLSLKPHRPSGKRAVTRYT